MGDAARPRLAEAGLWETFGMDYQEIIELIGREAGGLPDDAAEQPRRRCCGCWPHASRRGRRDACFRSCPPR
jgi:hypothetical protein